MLTPEFTELFRQSCAALAEKQGLSLETMTETEIAAWMQTHFAALMADTRQRLEDMKDRIILNLDKIAPVISNRVYNEINNAEGRK